VLDNYNKRKKELIMNLYTILGAALADEKFRELLFDNPLEAARSLGIVLTNVELDALKETLKTEGLEDAFEDIQSRMPCPRTPCPLAIARTHGDPVSSTIAAD
jgi:hypothetical protein